MRIKSINIKNFMSFKDFSWENIDPNLNIIVGPNGSGKTNFFNALRIFSELLNDRGAFELLNEIKSFAHLGNRDEKIILSINIEFENIEKNIILEFIRASLIGTLFNRGIQFDSVSDEALFGFLKVDDIADFFTGTLTAEYDFLNSRWNVKYETEMAQCLIDGNYSGFMLASESDEGLVPRLRDKFIAFLKANFKEEQLQPGNIEQITTKISIDGKLRTALRLSIDSHQNNLKSFATFRNLINEADVTRGYNARNLFGWLLSHAFVFTDNIRELPKTKFSSKEIEDERKNDSISSKNIAFLIHRLKNGNLKDREKFFRIKDNFKTLTDGLDFDILENLISIPIQTVHQVNLSESLSMMSNNEDHQNEQLEINISLDFQVINHGHEFPLRYSGAGIWETLYFSCLMESRGNIFLLDEPVANVHPSRQKLLSKKFQTNPNSQLFINTHSPYLTGLEDIQKISRFDLDPLKKTTIRHFCSKPLENKTLEILSRSKTPTSSLFSRAVILVEGETENAALPKWFNEYFSVSLEDKNIILICVGGKKSFIHYLELLESFRVPWAILCDGDAIGSTSDTCEIGWQLEKISKKFDSNLKTLNFQERKLILKKYGVFTIAQTEKENFESMKIFGTTGKNEKSKPERGYEMASDNPCPYELKEYFFDNLKKFVGWSDFFKLD